MTTDNDVFVRVYEGKLNEQEIEKHIRSKDSVSTYYFLYCTL
jgi:hypothetical protein